MLINADQNSWIDLRELSFLPGGGRLYMFFRTLPEYIAFFNMLQLRWSVFISTDRHWALIQEVHEVRINPLHGFAMYCFCCQVICSIFLSC